jgi:hypothetical protein
MLTLDSSHLSMTTSAECAAHGLRLADAARHAQNVPSADRRTLYHIIGVVPHHYGETKDGHTML